MDHIGPPSPETLDNNALLSAFKDAAAAYDAFGTTPSTESELARAEAERLALVIQERLRSQGAFMVGEERYEMLAGKHFGYDIQPLTVDFHGLIMGYRKFGSGLTGVELKLRHPRSQFAFCEAIANPSPTASLQENALPGEAIDAGSQIRSVVPALAEADPELIAKLGKIDGYHSYPSKTAKLVGELIGDEIDNPESRKAFVIKQNVTSIYQCIKAARSFSKTGRAANNPEVYNLGFYLGLMDGVNYSIGNHEQYISREDSARLVSVLFEELNFSKKEARQIHDSYRKATYVDKDEISSHLRGEREMKLSATDDPDHELLLNPNWRNWPYKGEQVIFGGPEEGSELEYADRLTSVFSETQFKAAYETAEASGAVKKSARYYDAYLSTLYGRPVRVTEVGTSINSMDGYAYPWFCFKFEARTD